MPFVPLMSRKVNLEWVANLELLEVNDPPKPLPGASVRRVWTPDDRLVIRDAKSSDRICYYDSAAAVCGQAEIRLQLLAALPAWRLVSAAPRHSDGIF